MLLNRWLPEGGIVIEGEEIYLEEELGRKNFKNKHSRILCEIKVK